MSMRVALRHSDAGGPDERRFCGAVLDTMGTPYLPIV
jgi:hypothetical protein